MRQILALVILLLLTSNPLLAGNRLRSFMNWIDSADVAGCDTNYVKWPQEGFIASFNTNLVKSRFFFSYQEPTDGDKKEYEGSVSSRLTTLLSVGLSYRGWGLSYSRGLSSNKDEELSFNTYGQTYGAEIRFRHSYSLSGRVENVNDKDIAYEFNLNDVYQKMLLSNIYYVFNHKKFSLPAALSQTVIQRKSAGSWLAAVHYYHSSLSYNDDYDLSFTQVSLGGGYAYNWVFGNEHCLLHCSATPLINVYCHNKFYTRNGKESVSERFSVNGNAHLSFVYNYSRYISGISSIYNLAWSNLANGYSSIDLNWTARLFIGVRF